MPKKATEEIQERVRHDIITVAKEIRIKNGTKPERRRLARELEKLGIVSFAGGKKWADKKSGNTNQLDRALKICKLDLTNIPSVGVYKVPQDIPSKPDYLVPQVNVIETSPDSADVPQGDTSQPSQELLDVIQGVMLPQFDQDTADALREVALWWKERSSEDRAVGDVTAPKFKPFKKNETNTYSVRLPTDLVDAVNAKIAREGAKTGGTFSRLVMWLLWRYLGCPGEYLESSGKSE